MGMVINPYAFGVSLASSTLFLCRFGVSPPLDEVSLNTGTLVGNATVNTGNNYVTTDGTGDWVTFPASTVFDLNTTDFTLEVHASVASGQVGGIVGHTAGGLGRWAIFCNGNGTIDIYFDNANGGIPMGNFGAGAANGTMRHFAMVRQGSAWKTYIDGVNKTTANVPGAVGSQSVPMYIGTDPFNTTSRDIAANIGRVKISNTPLWTSNFTSPAITDA